MRLAQVGRPAGSPPGCAEIITGAGMLLIGRTSIYFNAKSVLTSVVEMTISRCGSSLAFHTGQEEEEKVGRYTAEPDTLAPSCRNYEQFCCDLSLNLLFFTRTLTSVVVILIAGNVGQIRWR